MNMEAQAMTSCNADRRGLVLSLADSLVQTYHESININFRDMACQLESKLLFRKPDYFLSTMPSEYPADVPFEARLQLLQASFKQVNVDGRDFTFWQLLFGHAGELSLPKRSRDSKSVP